MFLGEWRGAGQELIKEYTERVDIRARVDIEPAHFRLLRAHVGGRPDHLCVVGEQCFLGEALVCGLGDAEVDHLGDGLAIVESDEDVAWLDVTVDHPFLMGVLDGLANLDKEVEAFCGGELVHVTVGVDGHAFDEFHHEEGTPGLGGASVQHFGDVGVIHQCQRLALSLEAGHDGLTVHTQLDDFECDLAPDGFGLLGHEDRAHPAFADGLKQLVATDDRSWLFYRISAIAERGGFGEEFVGLVVGLEQGVDFLPELGVVTACAVEEGRALVRGVVDSLIEEGFDAIFVSIHKPDARFDQDGVIGSENGSSFFIFSQGLVFLTMDDSDDTDPLGRATELLN